MLFQHDHMVVKNMDMRFQRFILVMVLTFLIVKARLSNFVCISLEFPVITIPTDFIINHGKYGCGVLIVQLYMDSETKLKANFSFPAKKVNKSHILNSHHNSHSQLQLLTLLIPPPVSFHHIYGLKLSFFHNC